MGERFQRSYIPVNLTSVLGKMKAIIIKAISRYTDIYNVMRNMFFAEKNSSRKRSRILRFP